MPSDRDADIFESLGLPLGEKATLTPQPKEKPKATPEGKTIHADRVEQALIRGFVQGLMAAHEPEEERLKRMERLKDWKKKSDASLLADFTLFPDDPYEKELHATPHR